MDINHTTTHGVLMDCLLSIFEKREFEFTISCKQISLDSTRRALYESEVIVQIRGVTGLGRGGGGGESW